MKRYIIKNTNEKRDIFYCSQHNVPPFWLEGPYVSHSAGDSHRDLHRAYLYVHADAAQRQADKLNEKFAAGGSFFSGNWQGYPSTTHPSNSGKSAKAEYAHYAPMYEVIAVEQTITELTS